MTIRLAHLQGLARRAAPKPKKQAAKPAAPTKPVATAKPRQEAPGRFAHLSAAAGAAFAHTPSAPERRASSKEAEAVQLAKKILTAARGAGARF